MIKVERMRCDTSIYRQPRERAVGCEPISLGTFKLELEAPPNRHPRIKSSDKIPSMSYYCRGQKMRRSEASPRFSREESKSSGWCASLLSVLWRKSEDTPSSGDHVGPHYLRSFRSFIVVFGYFFSTGV
jgi:hypothetical protein